MRRAVILLVCSIHLVSCTTPVRMTVDEAPWIQVDTENFSIWTSVAEPRARRLAQRMELFRSVTEFIIGRQLPKARLPLRMFAFPDVDAYYAFGARGSVGQYLPAMDENVMVASLTLPSSAGTTTYIIQHEYIHFLLDNHAQFVYPAWYHEGFAEFLGATRFRANDVEIGGIPSRGVPLPKFRGRDYWTDVGDILGYGVGGHKGEEVWQRYAQSWALVHYFYFGRKGMGSGPRQVARYLQRVSEGDSVSEAVQGAFGVDLETLDGELRRYVEKGRYPGATIHRDKFPAPVEPTVTAIPRVDLSRELAILAYRQGRHRLASHYFERVLAAKPGDARAVAGQALLLMADEKPEEAQAKIDSALASDPENAVIHRIAGNLDRWAARRVEDDEAKIAALARSARKHYVKSWKLDDSVPATFAKYGSTYLLKGQDPAKGLKTLEHAHAMLPTSVAILHWLARVHMETDNPDEARRLALIAYSSPVYGTSLGKKHVEQLKKLLKDTGGLPRDPDEDE